MDHRNVICGRRLFGCYGFSAPSGSSTPCGACGCGSVGRASPCQGEGRGFESRHPLGRLAQRERASLTRKRSLVRSQYRPPESRRDRLGAQRSGLFSCWWIVCSDGSSSKGSAGWYVSPRTAISSLSHGGIAWNPAGFQECGGSGRGRPCVRVVMFPRWSGTRRSSVLYHLGRSRSLRQETDGYDGTLQASAARGPRR